MMKFMLVVAAAAWMVLVAKNLAPEPSVKLAQAEATGAKLSRAQ